MAKQLHLLKRSAVLLISGAFLWGCSPFSQEDLGTSKSFRFERVFSFNQDYKPKPEVESLLTGDTLLLVQDNGLVALDTLTGDVKWRFQGATPCTRPVVVDNTWVAFPEFPQSKAEGWGNQSLWILDLATGAVSGKLRILWPEDPVVENSQQTPFIWETWVEAVGRTLYFPLSYLPPEKAPVKYQGIFRLKLDPLVLRTDQRVEVRPQPVILTSPYQELTARPAFSQENGYFLLNGSNVEQPDSEPRSEGFFRRGDVRLIAWSLASETEVWNLGFSYLGYKTWNPLVLQNGKIFLGDYKALACVDASQGRLLWEVGVGPRDESAYFSEMALRASGNRLFTTVLDQLHCFSAETGEKLWTHDEPRDFTLDSNGELKGERVYLAAPTGLKVFEAGSGNFLGEDASLDIPGYRIQGIMPRKGDLMYILRSDELVAVRLGSEKN